MLKTSEFAQTQARNEVVRLPMWDVLRGYPGNVLLGGGARLIEGMVFTIYAIFPLTYLANVSRIPRSTVLAAITLAAFVLIFTIPLASRVADRTSRRKLFVIFSLLNGFAAFLALWLMQYSDSTLIFFCLHRRRAERPVGSGLWSANGYFLQSLRHACALQRDVACLRTGHDLVRPAHGLGRDFHP